VERQPDAPPLRLTVLGSGTLLPDDQRRSPCHFIEAGDARLLLDCGSGALHGFDRHRVPWRTLTHLALTHFHTDHVGDLAPLLFALRHGVRPEREEPFVLLGPPGLHAFLGHLSAAHGDFIARPGFPLQVVELPRSGHWEEPGGAFLLRVHPTPHTESSVAYRVERGGASVGYTGDTGPSDALGAFLSGAELLVAECGVDDPPPVESHLSPRTVAELARRVAPQLLVLTHLYPPLRPHKVAALVRAAGYDGEVVVALDGTSVDVGAGWAVLRAG